MTRRVRSVLLSSGPGVDTMSDAAAKLEIAGHPDVVRVLEHALAMAKSGQISGVAVVVSFGVGHYDFSLAGRQPLELHYGAGKVVRLLEQQIDNPRSAILRP